MPIAPRRAGRFWQWLNLATLAATACAALLLQWTLRRDCLRVQARYGNSGSFCAGEFLPLPSPELIWNDGIRRELLLATIAARSWLWPLASGDDVRRGAEQQLVESARSSDCDAVIAAVAAGALDPCFGALHFALAWSENHHELPAVLREWLDAAPHQQLFAVVAMAMLTGSRSDRLRKHLYDPLPSAGDAASTLDELAAKFFAMPLTDAAARSRADFGNATLRARGEIVLLLATCPRRWGLF
ncbi:MAG: hypothetical protein EXS13_08110 [Planctomycetes bacterium]|nr:hypothetical protein [Planctomycetota bacterium]